MEDRYSADNIINECYEPLWQQFNTGLHGKDLKKKYKQQYQRTLSREFSDLMATFENLSRQREAIRQRQNKHKSLSRSVAKLQGELTPRDKYFHEKVRGSHVGEKKVFGVFPSLDPDKLENDVEADKKSAHSENGSKPMQDNKKSFPPFHHEYEPIRIPRAHISNSTDFSDLVQTFWIPPDNKLSKQPNSEMLGRNTFNPLHAPKKNAKPRHTKAVRQPEDTVQAISDLSENCFGRLKYRIPKLSLGKQTEYTPYVEETSKPPPQHVLSMFPKSYRGRQQRIPPKRDVRLTLNDLRIKSMVVPTLPEITDKPLVSNSAPTIGSKNSYQSHKKRPTKQFLPVELYDENFNSRWFEEEESSKIDTSSESRKKLVVRLPVIPTERDTTMFEDELESPPKRACVDRTNKISYTNNFHKISAVTGGTF